MATPDPIGFSDAELDAELERLLEEERHLSARRTTFHERMSFLGAGDEQIPRLRDLERTLSTERQALHVSIDLLRAELGRRGIR